MLEDGFLFYNIFHNLIILKIFLLKEMKELEEQFFNLVPFNVAMIDREFNLVKANENFRKTFGDWEGKKCYYVCKQSNKLCSYCKAKVVFNTGEQFFSHETGKDKYGRDYHYIVEFVPIVNEKGEVTHIIEMSSDILKSATFNSEYNVLFENVPTYISIIDKSFNIIKVNKKFREVFGDARGRKCYEVYKKRASKCKQCPAELTFTDGYEHSSTQTGITNYGEETSYMVSASPLAYDDHGVSLVIEMATDISEITKLQTQLSELQQFYTEIIRHSKEAIIAVNQYKKVQVFNKAARKLLNWRSRKKPGFSQVSEILPENFFSWNNKEEKYIEYKDATVNNYDGKPIPVELEKLNITKDKIVEGIVAFFRDVRKSKALEKENIDLYMYASIGKTIHHLRMIGSSLADSIRSDLQGIIDISKKLNSDELNQLTESLMFKLMRLSSYMKGMMGLQKINLDGVKLVNFKDFMDRFWKLNFNNLKSQNIDLKVEYKGQIGAIPLDYKKIEVMLYNFILRMNEIALNKGELIGLNLKILIGEKKEQTIINFETNLNFSEELRDMIITDLSFINLYVTLASYGAVVDVTEIDGKLIFSFVLEREKIMRILTDIKYE